MARNCEKQIVSDDDVPTLDETLQELATMLAGELEAGRVRMQAMGMSPAEIETMTRYGAAMHASQIALARAQILAKFSPR